MTGYEYLEPDQSQPDPVHVQFTEEQTKRVYFLAETWARYCLAHARTPPDNPMLAMLEYCENLAVHLEVICAMMERAEIDKTN